MSSHSRGHAVHVDSSQARTNKKKQIRISGESAPVARSLRTRRVRETPSSAESSAQEKSSRRPVDLWTPGTERNIASATRSERRWPLKVVFRFHTKSRGQRGPRQNPRLVLTTCLQGGFTHDFCSSRPAPPTRLYRRDHGDACSNESLQRKHSTSMTACISKRCWETVE
jgi:hypothetical protein